MVEKALRWILFAEEALTIDELREAVTLRECDEKRRRPIAEIQILKHCSSLLRRSNDGIYIESAHFTVKEFFQSINSISHPKLARFCMSKETAYPELSRACLSYLNLRDFIRVVPSTGEDMDAFLDEFPLYLHSSSSWVFYASYLGNDDHWNKDITLLAGKLFGIPQSSNFRHWWRGLLWNRLIERGSSEYFDDTVADIEKGGDSMLHWAALLKLPKLVLYILSNYTEYSQTATQHSGYWGTPLHAAALGELNESNFASLTFRDQHIKMESRICPTGFLDIFWFVTASSVTKDILSMLLEYGSDQCLAWTFCEELQFTVHELLVFTLDPGIFDINLWTGPFLSRRTLRYLRWLLNIEETEDDTDYVPTMRNFLSSVTETMIFDDCKEEFHQFYLSLVSADLADNNRIASDSYSLLYTAASNGQEDLLRDILETPGLQINDSNEDGNTAIHFAAKSGSLECVKLIMAQGGNVFAKDDKDWNCLHHAAMGQDNVAITELFCAVGLDPMEKESEGRTSLHIAAETNNLNIIKWFIENRRLNIVELNTRDEAGRSALLAAAECGSEDVLLHLLQYGSVRDATDAGESVALLAAQNCSITTINQILDVGVDTSSKDSNGNLILHYLLRNGHDVSQLVSAIGNSVSVNIPNERGDISLHELAYRGSDDQMFCLCRILLDAGANPIRKNDSSNSFFTILLKLHIEEESEITRRLLKLTIPFITDVTVLNELVNHRRPLSIVAKLGELHLAERMLEKGADPLLPDDTKSGESALEFACRGKDLKLVDAMLATCPMPLPVIRDGDTLLHVVCRSSTSTLDIVERLVSLNLNVNARGRNGDLPLVSAIMAGNTPVAIALLEHGANPQALGGHDPKNLSNPTSQWAWSAVHWASYQGSIDIIQHLINLKDVNWSSRTQFAMGGKMPSDCHVLHVASCRPNNGTCLELLLERCGKDVDCQTATGSTPLHFAAWNNNAPGTGILLAHNADVNIRDCSGETALHLAARKGCIEVISLLLENGAIETMLNNSGYSPDLWAQNFGNVEAAAVIREHYQGMCIQTCISLSSLG
jgi:ankyrin repeat protein